MSEKCLIHPAQRRLIEALARRDVARYLRSQAAQHKAASRERQNHVQLQREHKAA